MDSVIPSAFFFVNGESVEKADGAVQRNFDEVIWKDDSACLILMAKGSDGGDQETLDRGAAARLLHLACRFDAVECTRILIEGKQKDSKDKKDLSLLLRASKAGDESVVKLLLKARVDVNEKDADGNSALHWCLRAGGTSQDPRLTWLLIKHGAKVSQRNRLGLMPFHLAAAKGNYQALQILLLQAPECVDLASETKETPLFFAVKNNFLDCAKVLLRYGATTQALNLRKERPVDLAKSQEMCFILSPANVQFLNCTSPAQEGEDFMFAKVDSL